MGKSPSDSSLVRSSAAEYLTYIAAVGDDKDSVEMRYEDENIWLTQKMMSALYGVSIAAINQHIKKIANDNQITSELSVNWARHTFTTLGINVSLTLEELRQFLGHQNIRTTQTYVGSIEDENKQKLTEKIFNF